MKRFSLSIVSKTVLFNLLSVALTLAVVVTTVWFGVERELLRQAQERQASNMHVAWHLLSAHGTDFSVADGVLMAGGKPLSADHEVVDRVKELVGGTATIFVGDMRKSTNIIKPDGSRAVGTALAQGPARSAVLDQGKAYRGEAEILGETYLAAYDPIKSADGKVLGVLYVGLKKSDFLSAAQTQLWHSAEFGIAAALAIAVCGLFVIRKLMRGLLEIERVMGRLAGGELTVEVPHKERGDEVGQMARAVQSFKDGALENESLRAQQEEHKQQAERDRKAAMQDLASRFEQNVQGVVKAVSSSATELQASAETLSAVSLQTMQQCTSVAAGSEQASANVSTVAAASSELASSTSEIGRQVSQSGQVSAQAVEEAGRVETTVRSLAEAVQDIGNVVALIDQIASQTNLLALNATIEAARAGDAGKGFAVVAGEVKQLANQTAKATEQIVSQIARVQDATGKAVDGIGSMAGFIARMSEIAATISSAVEEQGAATQEIARNVEQASEGTEEVSRNIQGVAEAAAESGAASTEVLQAANELSEQAAKLRQDVETFIATIRAA